MASQSLVSIKNDVPVGSSVQSNNACDNEKNLIDKLDPSTKILWQLLSTKLGDIESKFTSLNFGLNENNNKILRLESKVDDLQ